jgi:hypothetical protein
MSNYMRRQNIIARIEANCVTDAQGCYVWQGRTSGKNRPTGGGYGRMELGGVSMAVHRVVFTHYFGIIPHKKQIDHTCTNRLCCNPDHLEMVTHKQNCRRRDKRKKNNGK